MKKIIAIMVLALTVVSCAGVIDKKPLNIISDKEVWEDPVLIDAYLTEAYLKMHILNNETPEPRVGGTWEDTDDWNGPYIINELSDEGKRNWIVGQSNRKFQGLKIAGGLLEWWEDSYVVIRMLNELIERLPASSITEDLKNEKLAEARFLRAYNYFSMVKRYGGVPIITRAQAIDEPYDELYLPRDSEQAVYDFVLSETEDIAGYLTEEVTTGRPTKAAALALQCRAALYAGSIAQFGTIQLDGLLGIESSKAREYYRIAYEAAKRIDTETGHDLYQADVATDKVRNFKNIFLVKAENGNPEPLWMVKHTATDRGSGGNGWTWDFFQAPKPHGWNAGNQNAPYLEMVEEFEYTDGTSGKLDYNAIQEGLWTMEQLWGNKDPRFFATIYTMNTPWQGGFVDWHNGLLLGNGNIETEGSVGGISALGTQSVDRSFGTGFGVMKYLDETKSNMGERGTSGTDWQIFRYGEVLLNLAEAAFELGETGEALGAINQLRRRAGVSELSEINRDDIRHERKVELAFEGHRYWDLRRWRIAEEELNINRSGLRYIMSVEDNSQFQLQVLSNIDGTVETPVFHTYNYYFPITLARTVNNPKLLENPGYF